MELSYFRFIVSLLFINFALIEAADYEKDITFQVQAGKIDCFYQKALPNQVIDLEYQVIDSSHGDLDISFQLTDPQGQIISGDYKKRGNTHQHTAALNGDYRFCFDNTFSTFASKTVFFDLLINDGTTTEQDYEDDDKEMDFGQAGSTYTMKVRDILESVNTVRDNVSAARRLQELLSAHEARDRNLSEEMCARVMVWSALQICLVAVVGIFQVVFVKSLFEQKQFFDWKQYLSRSMMH